ncbi:MAG: hypothetical protein JXR84_04355 [Anaerolineae bacterium]|nr:hypothetical protein [Anaerolineae bacterium]
MMTRSQRLNISDGLQAMAGAASEWQDEFSSDEALAAVGLELVEKACRVAQQAVQSDEVADLRGLEDSLRWLKDAAREKRAQMREMRAAVNVQRRASVPESVR